jgi:hypothetical protein
MRTATRAAVIGFTVVLLAVSAGAVPRGKRPPRSVPEIAQPQRAARSIATASGATLIGASNTDGVDRLGPPCRPRRDMLAYHGGDLVTNPDVFVIFWGSQWQNDQEHLDAKATLLSFFQQVGTSTYACTWNEYGVAGMPYGSEGLHNPAAEIISTAPPSPLSDLQIQQRIVSEVGAGNAPPRTDDMVYVVVPPKGVPVDAGGETGCGGSNFIFCGYHDSFLHGGGRFRYAVLPFPCNQGGFTCFIDPTNDAGQALQSVGSHELGETVTDPDAPPVGLSGWFSDRTGEENGDICADITCGADLSIGVVNSLWSNLAKGCVAGVPCAPPQPIGCTGSAPGLCVAGTAKGRQCAFEWLVDPNLTRASGALPGGVVTCADGQPFCDFDGAADGKCVFHVAACLNSVDPRVSCTPTSIGSVKLTQPSLTSANPTDTANATTIVMNLKDVDPAATGTVTGSQIDYAPLPGAQTHNACTGFLDISVPTRTVGTRTVRGVRGFGVLLHTAAGITHNRLTLICNPRVP